MLTWRNRTSGNRFGSSLDPLCRCGDALREVCEVRPALLLDGALDGNEAVAAGGGGFLVALLPSQPFSFLAASSRSARRFARRNAPCAPSPWLPWRLRQRGLVQRGLRRRGRRRGPWPPSPLGACELGGPHLQVEGEECADVAHQPVGEGIIPVVVVVDPNAALEGASRVVVGVVDVETRRVGDDGVCGREHFGWRRECRWRDGGAGAGLQLGVVGATGVGVH